MTRRTLLMLAAVACSMAAAHAQLATSLKIAKKQHLAGEPVIAVVTITNHSGRELIFQSDGRFQWLDFLVKTSSGNTVTPKSQKLFGPMKIAAGQTLAREVDLAQHYQLSGPGNFTVTAVIHTPGGSSSGNVTNRDFFNQVNGRIYWSQKVGVSGRSGLSREFRLINFSSDSKSQIYAQIVDGQTGQLVRTFLLGDALMIRKPLATVDRQQRMHAMFLATPTMWVHCVIDTDGRLVNRQIHQRGYQGDPQLVTLPDGSVGVTNSIPYDAAAAAKQRSSVRKASERPAGIP